MSARYHDRGIRFDYPSDWVLEVNDDGARTTVSVYHPSGTAFAMFALDEDRPVPQQLVDEALSALSDDYPGLDVYPSHDAVAGHDAVGADVEFISLDMIGACTLRSFTTPRQTVLLLGQWIESTDGAELELVIRAIRMSVHVDASGG